MTQLKTIILGCLIALFCFNASASDFFKEGCCYWYCYQHSWGPTYVDFGIRIAEKEMIDGKEWNRIDLIKRGTHIFENGGYLTDKVDVDDTVIPVAYVRDEDGKIITSYKPLKEKQENIFTEEWMQLLYGSTSLKKVADEFVNYEYGPVNKKVTFLDDFAAEGKVAKTETYSNSGHTYNMYTLAIDSYLLLQGYDIDIVVIESIGAFGPYDRDNENGYPSTMGSGELIYNALFPGAATRDYNPWLKYVTEGDDNNIIFEKKEGFKLWEYKGDEEGVETVESDIDQSSRWFNLQGMEIAEPATPGIYIRKSGNKVMKVRL